MSDLTSADFRATAGRANPQYDAIVYALMCIAETQADMVAIAKRIDERLEILTGVLEDWKREVT